MLHLALGNAALAVGGRAAELALFEAFELGSVLLEDVFEPLPHAKRVRL